MAQTNFNRSKNDLEFVNRFFIDAQNSSFSAASAISSLRVKIAGFKEDVQAAFSAVGNSKQNLVHYQNLLTNCSFDTNNAQNAKEIAGLQNDIANSDLHSK